VAGLPALLCLGWHVLDQSASWLLSWKAAALLVRIVLNQAVLEEWLARGLLLGLLLAAGVTDRRALWVSAVAFGLMHLLQFAFPPYDAERAITAAVMVVLTTFMGAVLALLVLRGRSLWPAVLLHLLTDLPILPQKLAKAQPALILLAGVASLILVPLGFWLLGRERRAVVV
jgi:membrane protease YdiL (CAAX protease family)